MRVVVAKDIRVPATDLRGAFDVVFGAKMLKGLYGDNVQVGAWDGTGSTRKIRGTIDMPGAPKEVLRILSGSKLRATTTQVVRWAPTTVDVDHKVRMHFLGAELINVRPRFQLRQARDAAPLLDATVEVSARLPPPINGMLERFMEAFAARQIATTIQLLEEETKE